jgi:hypothetical protein
MSITIENSKIEVSLSADLWGHYLVNANQDPVAARGCVLSDAAYQLEREQKQADIAAKIEALTAQLAALNAPSHLSKTPVDFDSNRLAKQLAIIDFLSNGLGMDTSTARSLLHSQSDGRFIGELPTLQLSYATHYLNYLLSNDNPDTFVMEWGKSFYQDYNKSSAPRFTEERIGQTCMEWIVNAKDKQSTIKRYVIQAINDELRENRDRLDYLLMRGDFLTISKKETTPND